MSAETPDPQRLRWRLVLGEGSDAVLGGTLDGEWQARDAALEYLYGREYGGRNVRGGSGQRGGDLSPSSLTVPQWIDQVHRLFPKETIERIERDALERYQLQEMVTNPELLKRAVPSTTLLKAVLQTKHLMNPEVLGLARQMVRRVIDDLLEKFAQPVRAPFSGAINRQRRSSLKIAKNFDAAGTIRRNLKHYDPERRRLMIQHPQFFSRIRPQTDRWQIIILVDESGSMLDSVIHSAVTASIFWGLRAVRTHLCIFDTEVVDLTEHCADPVETLMKVQLGGGTDIGHALGYAKELVDNPRRTVIVLITDFYEGGPPRALIQTARQLIESGVTLLGLASLDDTATPDYDRHLAQELADLGAHVGAMTPGQLAGWLADKIG